MLETNNRIKTKADKHDSHSHLKQCANWSCGAGIDLKQKLHSQRFVDKNKQTASCKISKKSKGGIVRLN